MSSSDSALFRASDTQVPQAIIRKRFGEVPPAKPIEVLLRTPATVFTIHDLRMLWKMKNAATLKVQVHYYIMTGKLFRLHRGVYALHPQYNPFELAQKLLSPSYISLETALREHGALHQYGETITCVASYPRAYVIDGREYRYHQMSRAFFSSPLGILQKGTYSFASPERALCDALYLGFNPDVADYVRWDKALLKNLAKEFSAPRVRHGLHIRSLL